MIPVKETPSTLIDVNQTVREYYYRNVSELVQAIEKQDSEKLKYYRQKAESYCERHFDMITPNTFAAFLGRQIAPDTHLFSLCLSILVKDPKKQMPHERTLLATLQEHGFEKYPGRCFYQGTLYPSRTIPKRFKMVKDIDLIHKSKKIVVCAKHTNNMGGNQDSDSGYVENRAVAEAIKFLDKNKSWKVAFINDGNFFTERNSRVSTTKNLFIGGNELVERLIDWAA